MMTTNDICEDLGVCKVTVLRWLREGKLKGVRGPVKREGWKIEETDYEAFLDSDKKWKAVHEGGLFSSKDLAIRDQLLNQIDWKLTEIRDELLKKNKDRQYLKGWNGAFTDIRAIIDRERLRRSPV